MKFLDYIHESEVNHNTLSYNLLTPKPSKGNHLNLVKSKFLLPRLYLLAPYTISRIMEQVKAVVPLAAICFFSNFNFKATHLPVTICLGLIAVIIGLAIFYGRLKQD